MDEEPVRAAMAEQKDIAAIETSHEKAIAKFSVPALVDYTKASSVHLEWSWKSCNDNSEPKTTPSAWINLLEVQATEFERRLDDHDFPGTKIHYGAFCGMNRH